MANLVGSRHVIVGRLVGLAPGAGLDEPVAVRAAGRDGTCYLVDEAILAVAGRTPLAGHEGPGAGAMRGTRCPGRHCVHALDREGDPGGGIWAMARAGPDARHSTLRRVPDCGMRCWSSWLSDARSFYFHLFKLSRP